MAEAPMSSKTKALDEKLAARAHQADRILQLESVVNEIRDRVHLLLRIRPVTDCSKPGRLHEPNQVGWNRHAHLVPSPQQFQTDGGAGLDVAASSMGGQDNFHRRSAAPAWRPSATRLSTDLIARRYRLTESLAIGLFWKFTHIDTSSKRRITEI